MLPRNVTLNWITEVGGLLRFWTLSAGYKLLIKLFVLEFDWSNVFISLCKLSLFLSKKLKELYNT